MNASGQEFKPLPTDEVKDIIYDSMTTTWKNKIIKLGFNYADSSVKEMTDFFETRVENLESREKMKKSSIVSKKKKDKKATKNRNEMTLSQGLKSPAKNILVNIGLFTSNSFYIANVAILRIITRSLKPW